MAHFAQIGRNNKVLRVVKIENADMLDSNGVEQESIGQNFLAENHGIFPEWVQCSINTFENVHALGGVPLRANFPGVGCIMMKLIMFFIWEDQQTKMVNHALLGQ